MHTSIDAMIDRQLRRWEIERYSGMKRGTAHPSIPVLGPLITVSRQHGSIGTAVAARLAEHFRYTLLHRDTIDRMCESTGYARRLLQALDDHARSQLTTWVESMMAGTYVDAGDYLRALLGTIFSIAQLGGVVVVGRGANFIVGPDRGFHLRVVASRDTRIRAIVERKGIPEKDAAREVDTRDRERADFVRRMFGRSVDDPLAYDLVLNADDLPADAVDDWLAAAARRKFERMHLLAPPT
ncbi:MAG: AAA family ATPase [Candidatus Eisenbacteria bacterium]